MKAAFTALIAVIFLAMPFTASAQEQRIAVIDVQKLLSDSLAAKDLDKKLSAERQKFEDEFSEHERKLMQANRELSERQESLSRDEFDDRRAELEQKILETSRLAKIRKRDLDEAFNAALNRLRSEIVNITAQISEEKGYSIVLTRKDVVIAEKEIDITGDVLSKLDESLREVDVDIPAN